jgi:hypothetical protein
VRSQSLLTAALLIALAAIVVGCATTSQPPASRTALDNLTKRENLPGKAGCFWKSDFQGDWTVLNETTLIVRAPLPKNAYVIKLFEPVTGLTFMQSLGFEDKDRTGQICDNGVDYLVIPGSPRRVPIVAVHALTTDEQNQLLAAAGKRKSAAPAADQTASPKS